VLQQGRIVERGDPDRLFHDPQHPYTRQLIDAVPGLRVTRAAALAAE
jgi:peptide/nickel transport system ATP-binding protein